MQIWKHDLKWLMNRLNFNSIGARIDRMKYDDLFNKEFNRDNA